MPGNIRKIRLGDKEINGVEQEFEIGREEWNEYKLLDGGRIRVKTQVHKIFRIVDDEGNQTYTSDGEPNVLVKHRTDIVTSR